MSNIDKNIAERVKLFRKKLGFSQGEVAKRLDISQGYLSDIETGKTFFSGTKLISLVSIFRLNLWWLLAGEGPMFIEQRQGSGIVAETQPPWGALTPAEWEFIKLSRESPRLAEACRKILGGSATYKAGFEELQRLPDPSET